MSGNPEFGSVPQLFEVVKQYHAEGKKRDFLSDTAAGLHMLGIEVPQAEFAELPNPSIPTLVAANHFVPPLRQRIHPFTTVDAIVTTGIITHGIQQLTPGKQLDWLVQGDLNPKFLSFRLNNREMQQAAIECYSHIPVSADPKKVFSTLKQIKQRLKDGINIGVYPEGSVQFKDTFLGYRMGVFQSGFPSMLALLERCRIEYQILPTTVYREDGKYHLKFGSIIHPGNYEETAKKIRESVEAGLPARMKRRV